jgi:hypothetical protein
VARYQLVVGVRYTDKWPVGVLAAHPEGAKKGTVWRPGRTGEDALTRALQERLLKIG